MSGAAPMLLIRADASSRIGTGHVMRCLALAQAWKAAGGDAVFACEEIPEALSARVARAGFRVRTITAQPGSVADAEQTVRLASSVSADTVNPVLPVGSASSLIPHPSSFPTWVVADGYHFDLPFQCAIRSAGLKLLLIDDYGSLSGYEADALLNQNIDADRYQYPAGSARLRLLGTRYALLRPEFECIPDRGPVPAVARRVLVTMGGADPDNITCRVARALRAILEPGLEARILAGPAFAHRAELDREIAGDPRLEVVPFAEDVPGLMAWADAAVCAGGSTCWELLRMGVPFAVVVLADNQRGIAERLAKQGLALDIGWHENLVQEQIRAAVAGLLEDGARRATMSQTGQRLVDGFGARRVVIQMRASGLYLRRASAADAKTLWAWANDPAVRSAAFHTDPIPWETHVPWLGAKLASPRTAIFIAEDPGTVAIGQVRFDWDESGRAEVDVSIDAACRGAGLGAALIRAGVSALWASSDVQCVVARIKRSNRASVRAFVAADFDSADGPGAQEAEVVHLISRRSHE